MFGRAFFSYQYSLVFLIFPALIFSSCNFQNAETLSKSERLEKVPPVVLWAWERPEDLRFLDTEKFGVAFLAQTLVLQNDEIVFVPRRQPLQVSPDTFLIAVTRIETNRKNPNQFPSLSEGQKKQAINFIKETLKRRNVRAIQIDFDALASERNFYKALLAELRPQLPENISLTITALASWCAYDNWLDSLPVDEAVPMAFRMGADNKRMREFLAAENDWNEKLCRESYGTAMDEPLKINFKPNRRFYIFHNRSWRPEDLNHLPEGVLQ